jgi:hypothetical protein
MLILEEIWLDQEDIVGHGIGPAFRDQYLRLALSIGIDCAVNSVIDKVGELHTVIGYGTLTKDFPGIGIHRRRGVE